jgi:hypothetical protein
MAPWLGQVTAFRRTCLSGGGGCIENVGDTRAPHRGGLCRTLVVAVPPPLFTSFIRDASLVGGNGGIQK